MDITEKDIRNLFADSGELDRDEVAMLLLQLLERIQNLEQTPQRKPLTDEHPLMVFAKECALGAYQEYELADAANKAIEAADRIIKENT